jgi:hypothetical protein
MTLGSPETSARPADETAHQPVTFPVTARTQPRVGFEAGWSRLPSAQHVDVTHGDNCRLKSVSTGAHHGRPGGASYHRPSHPLDLAGVSANRLVSPYVDKM